MKLSNKVLIGFFGLIFTYMAAAFTEIRLKGDKNGRDFSDAKVESVDIKDVAFLVLPDLDQHINVTVANKPRIEVRSVSGDLISNLEYKMVGDTLELLKFDLEKSGRVDITVYASENNFRGVLVKGAGVTIRGLNQAELSITQTAGTTELNGNNKLQKLEVIASQEASLRGAGFELEELSIQSDNSDIRFWMPVSRLTGSMANESHFVIQSPDDIQFKKDRSCNLQIVN